jgi:AraC-like DNA-binding protein
MAEARRLLRETDLTIEAVASRVGYAQPSYFIKHFSRDHGITPAIWRRQARASNRRTQFAPASRSIRRRH